jgi:hypothetical protein
LNSDKIKILLKSNILDTKVFSRMAGGLVLSLAAFFFIVAPVLFPCVEITFAASRAQRNHNNRGQAAPAPSQAPADAGFLRSEAARHVKKIAASAEVFQKYSPMRDFSFYSKIKHIGAPRAVEISGGPAAYELPLIADDYAARFIYLSADGRLLYPPAASASGARYFLTEREWNEMAGGSYQLPRVDFTGYPAGYSMQHFPFVYNERHQNLVELCGLPVGQEALADFKTLDYIAQVPSKSIGKRKLNVLSRASHEIIELTPMKSFSYAAAYCADWWHIAASSSDEIAFERYYDFLTGAPAFGVNPRAVEMVYRQRAASDPEFFGFSNYMKDPLFAGERFHSSLEGYASALVLPEMTSASDAGDPKTIYEISEENKFYMDEEYIELFRGHEASAETLITALETHGIVMAGVSFYMKGAALSHPSKAVAVIGYKKAGGTTLFVYKDFEDPAKMFRLAPADIFCEAYCFAHEFRAKARYIVKKRKLTIETFDRRGNKINVDSISAVFPTEGRRVKFLREASGVYFHQVKKEDFSGVDRAKLTAEIKKKYFVSGDSETFTLRYAIY